MEERKSGRAVLSPFMKKVWSHFLIARRGVHVCVHALRCFPPHVFPPSALVFLLLFCFFLLSPQKSEVHLQETAKECVAGLWFAKERKKKERREKRKEIHTKVYSLPPCKPLFLSLWHIHARTHAHTYTHTAFSIMFMKKITSSQVMLHPPRSPSGLGWRKMSPAGGSSHHRWSRLTPGELL